MISSFVRALVSAFKAPRELALENVALRQQLAVLPRSVKRPRLSNVDREFWHRTRPWRCCTARSKSLTSVQRQLPFPFSDN